MPTALVTGITGQDGTYLRRDLVERGYEVHGVVKPGHNADATEQVTLHRCDIRDAAGLRQIVSRVQPDEVYNLAGQTSVAASWVNPLATVETTGTPVGVLLDAVSRLPGERRFVQASSAEIFGLCQTIPQNESTAVSPVSPYGAAKALGHFLVGAYRARGLHASSCILFNHESPLRPQSFVTRKITRAAARISLGLEDSVRLGNLDVSRDWAWAPDVVRALQLASAADVAGDYVIGTGVQHTVRDFVQAAFRATGISDWERYVIVDPALVRPADPTLQLADSSRARERLGWEPTVAFPELVRRMVEADLEIARATG
ncbi:MAG: GDPmannose 4,6-dehydratase [Homoserinimonas sp.]|nr:GDPmannose 4,6-dehydratase [Mycetocola sp.]MCU1546933.1 GDPmannose 4,6-dehydratase [Homoserinimonas sp.]